MYLAHSLVGESLKSRLMSDEMDNPGPYIISTQRRYCPSCGHLFLDMAL